MRSDFSLNNVARYYLFLACALCYCSFLSVVFVLFLFFVFMPSLDLSL